MQGLAIHDEMAAFLAQQADLNVSAEKPWVVFAEAKFQDWFDSFEDAYSFAAFSFAPGKFLIRNLRASEPFLPMIYVA